jgi:hypothetical protein
VGYSRVTTWSAGESLTAADLNAEFNAVSAYSIPKADLAQKSIPITIPVFFGPQFNGATKTVKTKLKHAIGPLRVTLHAGAISGNLDLSIQGSVSGELISGTTLRVSSTAVGHTDSFTTANVDAGEDLTFTLVKDSGNVSEVYICLTAKTELI